MLSPMLSETSSSVRSERLLLLSSLRRSTAARQPSTSPNPRMGQRCCPCRRSEHLVRAGIVSLLGEEWRPLSSLHQGAKLCACIVCLIKVKHLHGHSAPAWTELSHQGLWGALPSGDWWISCSHWCNPPVPVVPGGLRAPSAWQKAPGAHPASAGVGGGLRGNNAFEKKKKEAD